MSFLASLYLFDTQPGEEGGETEKEGNGGYAVARPGGDGGGLVYKEIFQRRVRLGMNRCFGVNPDSRDRLGEVQVGERFEFQYEIHRRVA